MRAIASVLAAGLLLLALPRPARPCAIATRPGERVEVADETAIIVWDEARKVEHFIRTISFSTGDVGQFGFLVPTPARPALGEVPLTLFAELHRAVTGAREDHGISLGLSCLSAPTMFMAKSKSVDRGDPVRVLERTTVAGYDVAVLESDSATALAEWLTSHGFSSRPQLAGWLAPYVAARWKLTAFRFRGSGEATTPTSAVRMSFASGRPFFPYREPADAAPTQLPWRTLRVHLVGGRKMEGSLVDGTAGGTRTWPGELEYAGQLPGLASMLRAAVPDGALPERPWLMSFLDPSVTRPPGELYFAPSGDAKPVIVPVQVDRHIDIPAELVLLVIAVGAVMWRRRARRRAAA
jgi:hypothetical protein